MLFGMKDDLKQMAARLAVDFCSCAGPIPVERLVASHIDVFEKMRSAGLTWEQISRLLAGAGVVRGDGSAFSPSHLRGVYGRQRKRLQDGCTAKPSRRMPPSLNADTFSYPAPPSDRRPLAESTQALAQVAAPVAMMAGPAAFQIDDDALHHVSSPGAASGGATVSVHERATDHDRNRVLALMRQATLARRAT